MFHLRTITEATSKSYFEKQEILKLDININKNLLIKILSIKRFFKKKKKKDFANFYT